MIHDSSHTDLQAETLAHLHPVVVSSTMSEPEVPKRAEEGLFYRLKKKAFEECRDKGAAYADCCRGRTLSVAWKCREEMSAYSACVGQHTKNLEELKRRWVDAGKPSEPDWDALLAGL